MPYVSAWRYTLQFLKPLGEGPMQSFLSDQGPGIYQLQFSGAHEQEDIVT